VSSPAYLLHSERAENVHVVTRASDEPETIGMLVRQGTSHAQTTHSSPSLKLGSHRLPSSPPSSAGMSAPHPVGLGAPRTCLLVVHTLSLCPCLWWEQPDMAAGCDAWVTAAWGPHCLGSILPEVPTAWGLYCWETNQGSHCSAALARARPSLSSMLWEPAACCDSGLGVLFAGHGQQGRASPVCGGAAGPAGASAYRPLKKAT
jgi:hypothetical protein